MEQSENAKSSHLLNIFNKIVKDFNDNVGNEKEPSNMLLKGHLFIENLMEEVLAVFDKKPKNPRKASFHDKMQSLDEIGNKNLNNIIESLYSLNEIRNNLAHNLRFTVDEASVNKIGINLGSLFILKKYEIGDTKVRENLLFCLSSIASKLGGVIYIKTEELKEKEVPNNEQKNSLLQTTDSQPSLPNSPAKSIPQSTI